MIKIHPLLFRIPINHEQSLRTNRLQNLSKGKAAADVAEVAKHLNITHVRDAENAGGIAECSHIMEFTV